MEGGRWEIYEYLEASLASLGRGWWNLSPLLDSFLQVINDQFLLGSKIWNEGLLNVNFYP